MTKVKRDLRVLGAQRLECFDSTAWNRYYSLDLVKLVEKDNNSIPDDNACFDVDADDDLCHCRHLVA